MTFRIFKNILIVCWILAGFAVFASALNNEIIFTDRSLKKTVTTILPQGWGFFTKDPREQTYELYCIKNNVEKLTIKNSSSDNLFGLSRKSRYIAFESSAIIGKIINSKSWQDTAGIYDNFIPKGFTEIPYNKNLMYFPKGYYIAIRFFPIPWAWHGKNQEKYRKYQCILIRIK